MQGNQSQHRDTPKLMFLASFATKDIAGHHEVPRRMEPATTFAIDPNSSRDRSLDT